MKSTKTSRILRALSPTGRSARAVVAVLLAGVLAAACDVHGVVAPGALASIVVTPNATMTAGTTQQMTAVGYDAEGRAVTITPTWSVAASGGTIGTTGVFTAGNATGVFANTVVASVGTIKGTASITVTAGAIMTIVVSPTPATLAPLATQQFTAVAKDAGGNVVAFTPSWSIVAGGGAIDQNGLFTAGQTTGSFANTVQASSGGTRGYASVTVIAGSLASLTITPNPDTLVIAATQQFVATGKDAFGNVVPATPTWSVVQGGGFISSTGVFTAGQIVGTFTNTVKATSGTIAGLATVVVSSGKLASITVTPNPVSLVVNGLQTFIAVGRDSSGNVVPFTPTWSVVNNGGSINSAGIFTAGTVIGTYTNTVQASNNTIKGFATVTVVPGLLSTIVVTPNPATMPVNGTQLFKAVGKDAYNNAVLITPVWTVVNNGGSIDATGLFTGGPTAGTYTNTVKATSGLFSGTATVTLTSVGPPPATIGLGAAAPNGIMAGASVTCITGGIINADVSISPGNTITGFGPCVITGTQHLADASALAAQAALTTTYNTLFGMPCPPANAIVADLGGTTKPAGVYCTASSIGVTGTLTLDGGGDPNATFVFQAGTGLTTAGNVVLIGQAQAKNVWWQVGTSATLGTASQWQGNIVALTSITLVDNATLNGRALARNGSVTLGTNNVITLP
ncbi:MAG: DUF3494 domain-containing protein [Proteobacteria bacterium]|nr:DUF3494 domain-containing protein [Pseudomonadota bacterium]